MVRIKSLHLGISLKTTGVKKNAFWRFGTWRNQLHERRNWIHLSAALPDLQQHCVIDYTYDVNDFTSPECVKNQFSAFQSANFHK